jgi:hypothetical protein
VSKLHGVFHSGTASGLDGKAHALPFLRPFFSEGLDGLDGPFCHPYHEKTGTLIAPVVNLPGDFSIEKQKSC